MVDIICGGCGAGLPGGKTDETGGSRASCRVCGFTQRKFMVSLSERIELLSSLSAKHRRPGVKRPLLELQWGAVVGRDGRAVNKERIIDRVKNRYVEKVVDRETGGVLRDLEEPLTQHRHS